MKRRNFIKGAALSSLLFGEFKSSYASSIDILDLPYSKSTDFIETLAKLKTTAPIKFYVNRKEEMYKQLLELKNQYGIVRFLFVGPLEEVRFNGFPTKKVYEEIGHQIKEAKERLAEHGILIGWWCAPSLRSGFDKRFQYITDLDGSLSDTSPCPLDPIFSTEFSQHVATVAAIANPYMIQFEDDYELSHQPPAVKFGCFCPLHLAEFSKRQGKNYTRENLLEIFKNTDKESIRLRKDWAALSKDSLVSLARKIRQKVDEVDSKTIISLCQSGSADFDGDFTVPVAEAFAGNTTPTVRLYGSSYSSDSSLGLPADIFHALYSIQHVPKNFECFHESDTYPHTRFFMSASKIKSLITTAFSYGFDQTLFYLTQYLDNPLEERGYARMYKQEAPRFLAIKQAVKDAQVVGCEIIHIPNSHSVVPYKGGRPELGINPWVNSLGRFGIPYTSKGGKVKMLAGKAVEAMSEPQIMKLFETGLVIDGVAAHTLCKMGYAEYIGVNVQAFTKNIHSCYEGIRNKGEYSNIIGDLQYNWIYAPAGSEGGSFYALNPVSEAKIVTDFLDEFEKPIMPSMVRFTNKLGGRILISAFDLSGNFSSTTLNYKKKEIIRQNLEWVGDEPLPIFVKNLPNVFCVCNKLKDNDRLLATIINLSSDPADQFELDVAPGKRYSHIDFLDKNAAWHTIKVEQKGRTLTIPLGLVLMNPTIIRL